MDQQLLQGLQQLLPAFGQLLQENSQPRNPPMRTVQLQR